MRRKINAIFTLIAALVLWTGCHDEFNGSADEKPGRAINFSCTTVKSRAQESTIDNTTSFRVSAVWAKSENEYINRYMDEQLVKKDENDTWVYSPVRDMPSYGSVDFFAYSPANASVSDFVIDETTHNQVRLTYDVTTDLEIQKDFMVADALGVTSPSVLLNFRHALSYITIEAKSVTEGHMCHIKEVKLLNIYRQGTLTGNISDNQTVWTWSNQNTPTTYTIALNDPIYTVSDSYTNILDPTIGPLMLLPQITRSDAVIYIVYDIYDRDSNYLASSIVAPFIDATFVMGKKHVLRIELE